MLVLCCQYGCGSTTLHSFFSSLRDNEVQTPGVKLALSSFPKQCYRSWYRTNTRTLTCHRCSPCACGPATSGDRNDHPSQTVASLRCSSWLFVCLFVLIFPASLSLFFIQNTSIVGLLQCFLSKSAIN